MKNSYYRSELGLSQYIGQSFFRFHKLKALKSIFLRMCTFSVKLWHYVIHQQRQTSAAA